MFNHLTSIVQKYLPFLFEQPFLYATLIHLRQNELLQWLFNVTIYLGSMETPNEFLTELQKLFHHQNVHQRQQIMMEFYQSIPYDPNINPVEYGRIREMIQYQQNNPQYDQLPQVNPSTIDSIQSNKRIKPKLSVTRKEFCSYLFEILINYETPLTIKQFCCISIR